MKQVFKILATAGNAAVQSALKALHQLQSSENAKDKVRSAGHRSMTCRANTTVQLAKKAREDHARRERKRWYSGRDSKPDLRRGGYYLNTELMERAYTRAMRWLRKPGSELEIAPRHIAEKAYL